jgi:hypothetical protein
MKARVMTPRPKPGARPGRIPRPAHRHGFPPLNNGADASRPCVGRNRHGLLIGRSSRPSAVHYRALATEVTGSYATFPP